MHFKFIKLISITALVIFSLAFGLEINAFPPEYVSVIAGPAVVGSPTSITVTSEHSIGDATWCIEVDFGDGSPVQSGRCATGIMGTTCDVNFSHTYSAEQDYRIVADSCNCARPSDCKEGNTRVTVGSVPPPAVCGNGVRESGEGCDDGNTTSGDGCSSGCQREGGASGTAQDDLNPLKVPTFGGLIDQIINVIFWIAIIALPLGIIAGGVLFLTAGSNPGNIELGKKIILYCAVILGLVIMIKMLSFAFKDDLTFTK